MANTANRCAIYTRKSSEEGLDQSFNSLDAQREACEAYVLSQASEGWEAIGKRYDDGGFSGGNTERPSLQSLLADIEAGHIDIVVVYKIDRLTRSLADFARIVEVFEANDCSFVSVTQSFNTTGSMGKLMLNVLLSFAQFEREVTGERIRDKIAASKAKGMWMGGMPPLGYDVPDNGTRTLKLNKLEADRVNHIFARYLELGSVHALQRDLEKRGLVSKLHTTAKGKVMGGLPFSRGALFHMLRNKVYLGKIVHKGEVYNGEHSAIVDPALFERVQDKLDAQSRRHQKKSEQRKIKSPLTGKLFDEADEPMSPTTSRGKMGRTYRYYVSASLQQGSARPNNDIVQRLSAPKIDQVVSEAVGRWIPKMADPMGAIHSVHISKRGLQVCLNTRQCSKVATKLEGGETILDRTGDSTTVFLPMLFGTCGGQRQIIPAAIQPPKPDPVLIAALRRAHSMLTVQKGMPVIETSPHSHHERSILKLAFLAPDIQRAILEGAQPHHLNLETIKKIDIPLTWSAQRRLLGFRNARTGLSGE